jgi:hypothetical protein
MASVEGEIRKELQTQFVTKVEYDPRHRILETQIASIIETLSKHVNDAELHFRELAIARVEVDQLQEDYKAVDERQRGATARALPWIAVVISFLGIAYQILQHIQFH